MLIRKIACLFSVAMFGLSAVASAANVVGWRTDGTGSYKTSTPPTKWSPTDNVVWKTPLPKKGNATPVIVGDKVFVCHEVATLVCINKTDGKIAWSNSNDYEEIMTQEQKDKSKENAQKFSQLNGQLKKLNADKNKLRRKKKKTAEEQEEMKALDGKIKELNKEITALGIMKLPPTHGVNGYATPTPVTDGKSIYCLFGNGVAAAYDLSGKRQWIKLIDTPKQKWGQSASPVLAGGLLFVQINNLKALDPKTGDVKWEQPAAHGWGSPIVVGWNGGQAVVTTSGDVFNPADGKKLASALNKLKYNAPICVDGKLYLIEGGSKAFELPKASGGSAKPLWKAAIDKDRYYSSPVLINNQIYAVTREGTLTVLNAADGQVVWTRKVKEKGKGKHQYYSSITAAGNFVYVTSDDGKTIVLEPGAEYKEVAVNKLETIRSSPVFEGSRVYLRTDKHLYCIGK